jgi:hypothetical protein
MDNNEGERKLLVNHILETKKVDLGINEFHLTI